MAPAESSRGRATNGDSRAIDRRCATFGAGVASLVRIALVGAASGGSGAVHVGAHVHGGG